MRWNVNSGSYTLGDIITLYKRGKLIINNDYQRGFVWSPRFQRDLIISLLKGYPINSLMLRPSKQIDENGNDDIMEVVDGQQRIKTIINFIDPDDEKQRLTLNSSHGNIAGGLLKSNKKINTFQDIDEITQINFKSQISIPFQTMDGNDQEIKDFFNMIQQQEEVKAGEIISNMPFEIYNDLKEYFEESTSFLGKIGFNNKRGNFLKILISNFGIKNNVFHLGSTDDEVIKFSRDLNESFKKENDYIKKDIVITKEKFKQDIRQSFTFLKRIETDLDIGKGKLRFLRLFLLITNNLKENAFVDIKFLSKINVNLSKVNNKNILIDEDMKADFIQKLIEEKIINDESEFKNLINLSDLFSKTKNISKNHLKTIDFWRNKIATNN